MKRTDAEREVPCSQIGHVKHSRFAVRDAVEKVLMQKRISYRSTSLEARTEIGIGIYSNSRRTR